jgi:hypothetical protein
LFFISLVFAPFLKLTGSLRYRRFSEWFANLSRKSLSLNLVAILLVLSQVLLRPYFPEDTHALFNDWAAMAYFMLFFLAGFILLSNGVIIEAIRKQRLLFLAEGALSTTLMFSSPHLFTSESTVDLIRGISSIFLAWSCGLAAIGYTRQYLNRDAPIRKALNEAIYPFYLLHQPVILLVGFLLNRLLGIPDPARFLLLTADSFSITCLIYWYLVRPFNFTRVIFGMRPVLRQPFWDSTSDPVSLYRR